MVYILKEEDIMKLEKLHENPEIIHVGTEENRCYYIPTDRAGSERRIMLGGDWMFCYYPSVEDIDVAGKRVLCRCDFNVPTKDGKITMVGKGEFPFKELVERLKDVGYDGPLIIEQYAGNYDSVDEVAESVEYLKNILEA